ncbi:MAG: helix-turn-helix transcriptional regulator [Clostridium sp.]
MNINQIIKEKRLKQNLTQEQVANILGVSTPAVNKWEKGISYPDITILSPLARLLKIDLNTLLSFNSELSDKEIYDFIENTIPLIKSDGYDFAFNRCMDKISEYPTCENLILNIAVSLNGLLYMYNIEDKKDYEDKIYSLLDKCTKSENNKIKYDAISILISIFTEKQKYDSAQKYIDMLPNSTYDKKLHQGNLYLSCGKLDMACELFEGKLVEATTDVYSTLNFLMEIALKQDKVDTAFYIANVIKSTNELFEMWDYNTYASYFNLYTKLEDEKNTITILEKLLESSSKMWDISNTKLYSNLNPKDNSIQDKNVFHQCIINIIQNDPDGSLSFIKDRTQLNTILKPHI